MHTRSIHAAVATIGCLASGAMSGQGRVQDIPGNWKPDGLRELSIARVTASSSAGPQYVPPHAVDGDRGTKWVAKTAPSETAPQWLILELVIPQEVTAVALFGGSPGNDGVQDGRIQVAGATPGQFATVATIRDAKSASWLATFAPLKTATVRFQVTRADGPSPHTDVNEIIVFGPRLSSLSAEELKAYASTHLAACEARLAEAKAACPREEGGSEFAADIGRSVRRLELQVSQTSERLRHWETLDDHSRNKLAENVGKLEPRLLAFPDQLKRAAATWEGRIKQVEASRQAAQQAGAREEVKATRQGTRVRLVNNRVIVELDEAHGAWDATWLGAARAAIRGARFAVQAGGQTLSPQSVKADVSPFEDKLGAGIQLRQSWGKGVRVERIVRVYHGKPTVLVCGRITNQTDADVPLHSAALADVSADADGWWTTGQIMQTPAAVTIQGHSRLLCRPVTDDGQSQHYYSTGVLALAQRAPATGLVLGYLTALEGKPCVQARFQPVDGGTSLSATLSYGGRILAAGKTMPLDTLCLSAHADPYESLERYGDGVAALARYPVRTGPTALWCSWYAHRLAMTEELVLANAAVAARHFKPLGFEIMQLDHGWQRGDVCGDWVTNERFPHGLKWLSEQLQSRFGLKLGVWIAPTVVAENTETCRRHPDWLWQDDQGKPKAQSRWFWKPNPMCYLLDASHPQAAEFIEDTFARLSAEGVSYYKIDFLGTPGSNQHDGQCAPGWGVYRRAVDAIRQGAGPKAWIRYTQAPPLLAVGQSDGTNGGADTGDAGLGGRIDTLRDNAQSLAAGYWLNNRLYNREVCDMSIRMQADVEEVRMRLAMMSLAGCSASFSDEFQYLPPSRLRLMQQCLPPGIPPMRPLDLFERTIPSLWHLHGKRDAAEWEIVGVFNFEDRPEHRTLDFASIGLPEDALATVFEFWNEQFLGVHRQRLTLKMPPQSSRILSISRLTGRPRVIGTNMHVLQGHHEIVHVAWDDKSRTLRGRCRRAPGMTGSVFLYVPPGYRPHQEFPLGPTSARLTHIRGNLWKHELEFRDADLEWAIPFDGSPSGAVPTAPDEPITLGE